MSVKAKFTCNRIEDSIWQNGGARKVYFNAVYSNVGENASFSKATPSGQLEMVIDKETAAYDAFVPGKQYYLTIEEAPAQ